MSSIPHRARPSARASASAGARPSGLGAQHVVAMFGATFVFPIVMGLDPNLAIMFSGHLHDPVPADLHEPGAELPRHQRLVRGRRRGDPRPGRRLRRRHRRDHGRRPRAARWSACSSTSPAPALIHKILPPAVTGAVVMLIGFNLAPVVAGIYWPQDQWVALLTATFMVVRRRAVPGLLVADRGVPRADLRLPASRGSSTPSSARSTRSPAPAHGKEIDHDRVSWACVKARRLDRLPERQPRRRRLGRARPELLAHLHPAGAARCDRADRGEHRPRQGRRRDDRRRPRPLHGPGHRRGRLRAPRSPAPSAARRPRRTPRTSASWVPPGSTPRRRTTWPRSWPSCSASAPSSARSSAPPPAASSAASPSSSTA